MSAMQKMNRWKMWAVYAVVEGTLVAMHRTEDEARNAAVEASMDNDLILTWAPVVVVERKPDPGDFPPDVLEPNEVPESEVSGDDD